MLSGHRGSVARVGSTGHTADRIGLDASSVTQGRSRFVTFTRRRRGETHDFTLLRTKIMPEPVELNRPAYAHVWTGNLQVEGKRTIAIGAAPVAGRMKQKRFITYIEVLEQGAHDPAIRALVQSRRLGNPRPMHRGRVNPNNTNADPLAYYAVHGQEAARLASEEMTRRWTANVGNNTVFVRGAAHVLAQQAVRQPNGFCYETTMWYDVDDVYVAFHCYDPNYRG
ncbi:MAG: hypothetical protein EBZ67_16435 [Chitinophagia bacterium]|nr:hypothetical protein [Chitinophagia bacterium]